MNQNSKRLLFLFSDTGGGHRSAASAVAQALRGSHGERAQVELVDALADYAPWPFDRLGKIYPHLVRLGGWGWAAGYRLSDGPRRIRLLTSACWPLARAGLFRLLRDHPADLIICCHPLLNHLLLRALAGTRTPLITLITDLNTAHAFWAAPGVARCLAPTARVRRCALAYKLPAERVVVTGLPVSAAFVATAHKDRLTVRRRLKLRVDLPTALLVNGAEGMGALYRISRAISRAIAESGVQAQLVVVAGRNERLRDRLRSETWPLPVQVEGFVRNMHEWMRAADLLVTKAGPSTISEALVMGLPIVLNGALPGQERPNVDYVVRAGAGVWAPTSRRAAAAVQELLSPGNPRLTQMVACARSLAQPDAAHRAAQIIWATANDICH
ncbi:MAG: glycosyltransferase [Chloroflexota bacterium]|nr:glycosyltransferase [Chloroflexota bacterium]